MKRFYMEGTDPQLDSFTLEEEKENGDLTEAELAQLDSIQVGEVYNCREGYVYHRIA